MTVGLRHELDLMEKWDNFPGHGKMCVLLGRIVTKLWIQASHQGQESTGGKHIV